MVEWLYKKAVSIPLHRRFFIFDDQKGNPSSVKKLLLSKKQKNQGNF